MKTYDAKDIRNVLLVGHGGSGKTTLLEAMLFTAGSITRMGTVEDRNTVSDHDPDEQRRQISVSLSMAPIEWKDVKINVLDAPGTADFVGDLRMAVRAADAVIVVVSAVDGVEVQTEYAWELAVEAGLPRAIFVNKLDRERADFEGTLAQLVASFGNQVAPFELPIGNEHEFRGIADLLHEKADLYPSGPHAEESEWPDDLHEMADPAREKLIEAVAESDDALIEEYLEVGTLPEEHIVSGAKAGFTNARLAPVICGSAAGAIGIDRLLDFIVEEFPSPVDRGAVPVVARGGEEKERACDPSAPSCALIFKTLSDPFVGHITMFRVFSGRIRPDSTVFNATQGTEERIGQLFTQSGKDHVSVPEVSAGDIGAVAKLQHAHTGDTWSTKDDPVTMPAMDLPEPLLAYAIAPKTKGDEDKLATGLARLREEDPSFRVARNEETHETVIYGMGEAHLDVQMSRLKAKFGVEVEHHPAKIAYRETIKRKVAAVGRHVKQTGGHGQYAVCNIEIEPLPRGDGFIYEDKIFGGVDPAPVHPLGREGHREDDGRGGPQREPDGGHQGHPRRREVPRRRLVGHGLPDRGLARAEGGCRAGGGRPARTRRAAVDRGARQLHGRHHGRPERQARQDPGDGADRRGQAADQRARPPGRGRPLRDRPALDDGRSRRVLDDVLPLRGDAVTARVEGHRGRAGGARGGPQALATLRRPG